MPRIQNCSSVLLTLFSGFPHQFPETAFVTSQRDAHSSRKTSKFFWKVSHYSQVLSINPNYWLKKYSHSLNVELFYLVGMVRTQCRWPHLSSSETAPRRQEESQAIYKFATKEQAVWTSKIGYQVKEFNLCMKNETSWLTEFIPFTCTPQLYWARSGFLVHLEAWQSL